MIKVDAIDIKILSILQTHGRLSNLEISEMVGITPAPTLRRIKKLESSGVIKSYSANISAELLNLHYKAITIALLQEGTSNKECEGLESALNQTGIFHFILKMSDSSGYIMYSSANSPDIYKLAVKSILNQHKCLKNIKSIKVDKEVKGDFNIDISLLIKAALCK